MSQGRILCCTADHMTILVTLFSTVVISGLAWPSFTLEASDVMDHYYFGGQLRGDTIPLPDCNPAHDPTYLNCIMTLTDADAAASILARNAMDQLANNQHHVTDSSIYFGPRDMSLHIEAMKRRAEKRNATEAATGESAYSNAQVEFFTTAW